MNSDARLESLRQHNPFTSSSVGDPWEASYSDVPSINQHVFQGLCQLITQKTAQPALNCAALVLGEVGSGKTHLISRVLMRSKEAQWPFAFAYIQPIEDPEQTYRYLLREVMINLCQPIDQASQATQLRKIVTKVFCEGIGKSTQMKFPLVLTRGQFDAIQHKAIERLTLAHPGIARRFLRVLFDYAIPPKRSAALHWLTGSILDTDDAALLQMPDRLQMSPAALEEEAREILISLGLLLARYHQPLVICFDRLENLETPEQLHALGKMLEFLVDKAKAMLPVACFRGMQWEEKCRQQYNQHITTRLETNKFELKGCTAEQALAIVQSRLACVPGLQPPAPLFPFDQEALRQTFSRGFYSPRGVITLANQRLRHIIDVSPGPPPSPLARLQEAFAQQYEAIRQDFTRYPPDRGRLRRALELYLRYGCPANGPIERAAEKYIDIFSTFSVPGSPPARTIFLIDIEQHHAAVGACLTRGMAFLRDDTAGKALYIRDGRCPVPAHWRGTSQKLQQFQDLGGAVMFLDAAQAAAWYALALLSYAVREGEITRLDAADRLQAIAPEELEHFVRENLAAQRHPAFQRLAEALTMRCSGAM